MAAKWADYLISAVQYNQAETHIVKVRTRVDNGDTVGAQEEMLRSRVVSLIEAGYSFCTIYASDGKWTKGAEVHTVTVNGVKYIRTDRDATARDNLGSLPRF